MHASLFIAALCYGIVIGIFTAAHVPAGFLGAPGWLFLAGVLIVFGAWKRRAYAVPVIVAGGVALGAWRGSFGQTDAAAYRPLYGYAVRAAGTVIDDPDTGANGVSLRLGHVTIDGRAYGGKIWVSLASAKNVRRADRVELAGKMSPGFGTYAGTVYRASLTGVERTNGGDPAGGVRDWFADRIRGAVSEPQAALGIGYLVGQKSALPQDLSDAFVTVGLTHVVVASGYNLTILVRLARRLFVKVSKYLSALAAGGMIVAFMAVTGLSPSMSRAGLVSGLSLLAWYYGRAVHPLVLLPFAAAVTLLVNPSYALGDLGWALSFTSFAGVMILAPLLHAFFFGDTEPGLVRQILGETVAATVATLPVILLAFGQFSNVSVLTNLLVLPLIPLAMLLTFIAGLSAIAVPPLARVIGLPADWLLGYMVGTARYFAGLPWAVTKIEITPLVAAALYGVIIVGCVLMRRVTRLDLRRANIVE